MFPSAFVYRGMMLKKMLTKFALLALLLAPLGALGQNIVVGDKEWRQVTDTVNTSWNALAADCPVSTGVCGGAYSGWTWADYSEVTAMWDALAGTSGLGQSILAAVDSVWAPAILDNFSYTASSDFSEGVYGLIRNEFDQSYGYLAYVSDNHVDGTNDFASNAAFDKSMSAVVLGSWMYRPAAPVPEPEIYAMLGLGLGLMGWVGRRRKQQAA